ncbi:hypothetical protein, partial [Klebsiella quasipneumoniae]
GLCLGAFVLGYAALLIALMMIVYIPPISLFIPQLLGLM